MNGETYQICRLTAEAKNALTEERELFYSPNKYENQIVFHEAAAILRNEHTLEINETTSIRPPIPDCNRPLLDAASKADVFGAMGSWNDSPAYTAHEKGLSNEYHTLSDELLSQIRQAILYAINEY